MSEIDKIQVEFDESPHFMAEEIARLREDLESACDSLRSAGDLIDPRKIEQLQSSRASNARLRAALEKLDCNSVYASIIAPGKESDYMKHELSCNRCKALVREDGKKELEAVKYAIECLEDGAHQLRSDQVLSGANKLREAFGLEE